MKFLVIMRRACVPRDGEVSPETLRKRARDVRKLVTNGKILWSSIFVSGGGAYVVDVDNAEDLSFAIRKNPTFKYCTVEIEPIVDTANALDHAANLIENARAPK